MDELDNLLGRPVSGGGLAGEDVGVGHCRKLAMFHDAQVVADDVHQVQQLALVLVDALDVYVEDGVRIDQQPAFFLDDRLKLQLVAALDLFEGGAKFRHLSPRARGRAACRGW